MPPLHAAATQTPSENESVLSGLTVREPEVHGGQCLGELLRRQHDAVTPADPVVDEWRELNPTRTEGGTSAPDRSLEDSCGITHGDPDRPGIEAGDRPRPH